LTNFNADSGWLTAGIYLDGSGTDIHGGHVSQDSTRSLLTTPGVMIASGVQRCSITGIAPNSAVPAFYVVSQQGTADPTCIIENNGGAYYRTGQNREEGSFSQALGYQILADGNYTGGFGTYHWLQGSNSVGLGSNTRDFGTRAKVLRGFNAFAMQGDNQAADMILSAKTTNNTTAVTMTVDLSAAGSNNQILLQSNQTIAFWCWFTARASAGVSKAWTLNGAAENNGGTLAWVGGSAPTASAGVADSGASGWTLTTGFDSAHNSVQITATGGPAYYNGTCRTQEIIN
jgi:hypothetical protein